MEQPKTIWLQPWCDGCEKHAHGIESGRQWCADEAWGPCDECGAMPVKFELSAVAESKNTGSAS